MDGDEEDYSKKKFLYLAKMKDGSCKSFSLSYLISSARGSALYRSFCRSKKMMKKKKAKVSRFKYDKEEASDEDDDEEEEEEEEEEGGKGGAIVKQEEDEAIKRVDSALKRGRV